MQQNRTSPNILILAITAGLIWIGLPGDALADSTSTSLPLLATIGRLGSYLGYWAAASLTVSLALAVCIRDR